MNSLPFNHREDDGNRYPEVFRATYEEMLDKAEADLKILQRAVQRRKRTLRRQKRRAALTQAPRYGRPAMVAAGSACFVTSTVLLATGHTEAGFDMLDRALTAWSTAFTLPPR
ncbi:hypothetical protein [Streptomyces sp. NPDC013171]|uniref:hypothetical protein n=1 Tax=Streptomyces sp. NPDC013171 TaxID=3364863 RepID=UPI0036CE00E9